MSLRNKIEDEIALFMDYLTVEMGLARNTRESYGRDLRLFAVWVKKPIKEISRDDILTYMSVLKAQNYAVTSSARKLAALKAFFRFMMPKEPLRSIPAKLLNRKQGGWSCQRS